MKSKRVTISDIAREAGVSTGTVSSVLNHKKNPPIRVSEKKREEILGIIERLSYVPRKSARELAARRTNTIGIIVHKLTPFFSELIELIQQEAFKKHLEIMPYITNNNPLMEETYLRQCLDGRVDGIITVAHTEGSPGRYRKFSLPPYNLKIVSYGPEIMGIPTFAFDYSEAGKIAYMHLKEIGCRKICCFGGEKHKDERRFSSFMAAASADGCHAERFTTGENRGISSFSESREVAKGFFKRRKRMPDGVFCFNDIMALGFIAESRAHGLHIPGDIAVIGCDNSEICVISNPGLTSVDANAPMLAKTALEKMEQTVKGQNEKPMHTKITPRLVVRGSTVKK